MPSQERREIRERTGALFELGQCVATPGAITAIIFNDLTPGHFLARHRSGDFGSLTVEDWKANLDAIEHGRRVLSAYVLPDDTRIWIITESDRSSSTILLPEEY